ncbi:hypothetical protein EJA23_07680 [Salmonella enterica subsp. enterica serovar Newport]|nr:hypothetical protein [Salmonella enterica subsp. enterica serovar Newport]EDC6158484.1 hypothetical protein [Salmonella enterica subsp. enterica serovar Newport]EDE2478638.1 hypothetical protein [Salmonella enterica subsp. enterica serovar Newport]EDH1199531.1 hypothetical protein [Salmonella enterica subsp. enterica serovar Newport]EDH3981844.1 hypothetical protein [Salmonella enterica subsp. enterica serovar Newport]
MESMAEGMIKDLVASGHALADDMTGAPSVLVRCLAAQLEVQLVRANALAAENSGLKGGIKQAFEDMEAHHDDDGLFSYDADGEPMDALLRLCDAQGSITSLMNYETPATDAFLAEVRASARNEGINYAASLLAAAFNHGFIDKPVSEVLDVTRMILSAKEDLANGPLPTDDGLSGEYAEKSIEEWAAQLRKGVQS